AGGGPALSRGDRPIDHRAQAGAVLLPLPVAELLPAGGAGAGAGCPVAARLAQAGAGGAGRIHGAIRGVLAHPHRRVAGGAGSVRVLGLAAKLALTTT